MPHCLFQCINPNLYSQEQYCQIELRLCHSGNNGPHPSHGVLKSYSSNEIPVMILGAGGYLSTFVPYNKHINPLCYTV